jgi:Sulfotransferase domain
VTLERARLHASGMEARRGAGSGLPTFLIIGAMRSGTSTLARTMAQHPEVFIPPGKEMHFFDHHFDRGIEWYRSRFEAAGPARAIGEATPTYMYNDEARRRMAETLPDARLIAILRDPVDRAYSHYWHNRARGREPLAFEEALAAEPERIAEAPQGRKGRYAYVGRGRYARQLERLAEVYPRESVLVLILEEFSRDPVAGLRRVWRSLGVDERFVPRRPDARFNRARRHWSSRLHRYLRRRPRTLSTRTLARLNFRPGPPYPRMRPEVGKELAERFRDDNRDLARWLGRDLAVWTGNEGERDPSEEAGT